LDHSSFRPRDGSFPPGSLRVHCHWLGVLHKGGHPHKLALSKCREELRSMTMGLRGFYSIFPALLPLDPPKPCTHPPAYTTRRFKVFFLNDDGDRDWSQTCGIRPSFLFERSLELVILKRMDKLTPPRRLRYQNPHGPTPSVDIIFFSNMGCSFFLLQNGQ